MDGGNFRAGSDDHSPMDCERWRDAISATADGEDAGVGRDALAAHLRECGGCREFGADCRQRPAARLVVADSRPDLADRIARQVQRADRASVHVVVRSGLIAVATIIAVRALPALFDGDDGTVVTDMHGPSHVARHFGAFSVAFAVGLAVVAFRPARARTMLPVTFMVAVGLAVTALADASEGRVTMLTETRHLPELAALLLVWWIARSPLREPRAAVPRLTVVEPPDDRAAAS